MPTNILSSMKIPEIDEPTKLATKEFIARISKQYNLVEAILFGSRARHDNKPDSDADVAVIFNELSERRTLVARNMAGIAFDVMLDTGVLIQAIPLLKSEILNPEMHSNPKLIANIKRDGITL